MKNFCLAPGTSLTPSFQQEPLLLFGFVVHFDNLDVKKMSILFIYFGISATATILNYMNERERQPKGRVDIMGYMFSFILQRGIKAAIGISCNKRIISPFCHLFSHSLSVSSPFFPFLERERTVLVETGCKYYLGSLII